MISGRFFSYVGNENAFRRSAVFIFVIGKDLPHHICGRAFDTFQLGGVPTRQVLAEVDEVIVIFKPAFVGDLEKRKGGGR